LRQRPEHTAVRPHRGGAVRGCSSGADVSHRVPHRNSWKRHGDLRGESLQTDAKRDECFPGLLEHCGSLSDLVLCSNHDLGVSRWPVPQRDRPLQLQPQVLLNRRLRCPQVLVHVIRPPPPLFA
uniref:Cytochrome cd1 nitrite reductase n=1 Tax=Heligmosomoides polygyrus TaxID=6339 RepID=A0A183GW34_HELPZ